MPISIELGKQDMVEEVRSHLWFAVKDKRYYSLK